MTICKICNKKFPNFNVMTNHLKKHNFMPQEYYDKFYFKENENKCNKCGKETKFLSIKKGYNIHCSKSCAVTETWEKSPDRKDKQRQRIKNDLRFKIGRTKGSKNKNPYPKTDAVLRRLAENPPPNWTGKNHSEETKNKMSLIALKQFETGERKVNPSMKGYFKPKHPEKYIGNTKNIIYRSSWEFKMMMQLDHDLNVKQWSSEELSISYYSPKDHKKRRYFPDFFVEYTNGNKELIEIKPLSQCLPPKANAKKGKRKLISEVVTYETNQAKWAYAKEWCKQNGVKFKVLTEHDLFPKVKKRK